MARHAQLGPSSAARWMTCPGSVRLCASVPDSTSDYAAEGTAAHELAEAILRGADGAALVGKQASNGVEWTAEMLEDVTHYTTLVQSLAALPQAALFVEQTLPIDAWTGEVYEDGAPASGTADAVILLPGELIVVDLKYGRGVEVEASDNPQLMLYALAASARFDFSHGPFERVRLVIVQPRVRGVSEHTLPFEELLAFGDKVVAAAQAARNPDAPLVPSEKACRFCRAKAVCPALREQVLTDMSVVAFTPDDLAGIEPEMPTAHTDAEWLAAALKAAPLVETWLKAVRAEAERRLLAGEEVPGYKLVQGRAGPRKWADPEAVEQLLASWRLRKDEMYKMEVISPTAAEALTKPRRLPDGTMGDPAIGPRQWQQLQALIVRSEGQPSIAPVSDKRPEFKPSHAAADARDVADL